MNRGSPPRIGPGAVPGMASMRPRFMNRGSLVHFAETGEGKRLLQ